MNTIHLSHICPRIFQNQPHSASEIWNQNIDFEKGKTYLIEAESGSGKSSLFNFLCGHRNDYMGSILFDEEDIASFSITRWSLIRSRHLSHLIQDLRLFSELTAFENIKIKNQLTQHCSDRQIKEWMEYLGIADKQEVQVKRLSFGQQQRVALLRALAQPFDFLLLDEPISHLDQANAGLLGELITAEAQRQQAGVIVSSIGRHLDLHYDTVYHL